MKVPVPAKTRGLARRRIWMQLQAISGDWLRQRGLLRSLLIGAALVLVLLSPAWGQDSPTTKPLISNPAISITTGTDSGASNISTDDVQLDGRKLFTIAAPVVRGKSAEVPEVAPVRERVDTIETTLNTIANSQFDPKTLQVTSTLNEESRLPVIYIRTNKTSPDADRYLMTVTTLDAQLQGQTPEQRAEELVQIVQQALVTARQERQPNSLTQQGLIAAQILLAMVLAGWSIDLTQRHLKAKRDRARAIDLNALPDIPDAAVDPASATTAPAILTVQEQLNQRQQRNLDDVRRRLLQVIQIGIWVGGSFVILGLFPYTRWLQPVLFSGPLKVLGIAIGTYVAIRASDILIDRFFTALTTEELITPTSSQRLALRVTTFSRVLRSVVGIILVGIGILSILSAIGVQIGPLLAGAGILGLAISFASQNLIKDMINGLLILSEDQYAVGDVIQVGKVSGLVEYMNLRITQLRNAEGRLITIPNSTITVVENLSKDWSRVDLAITIAYDADTDKAIHVIKQVGEELSHDPDWHTKISEPPEVLGIDEINNAGVTLRIWIKTLPLEQWNVAREFRHRLKLALDRQGIAIGLPQQSLWFRNSGELSYKVLDDDKAANSDKPTSTDEAAVKRVEL